MRDRTNVFAKGMLLALGLVGVLTSRPAAADVAAQPGHRYNVMGEGVGLGGYDPVSYFPEGGGKAERGLIGNSVVHDGVTYRFASKEHMALFQKTPPRFLPAYGGWCAWAVAELGKRVDIDPESFVVKDGKLFVFYRDKELDTKAQWVKNPAGMIIKADKKWPELKR